MWSTTSWSRERTTSYPSTTWFGTRGSRRKSSSRTHRELVSDAARALLEGGLAKIGNPCERIIPWPGTPEQVTSRLVSQCVAFDWQPMGDGCWIENTPAGDAWAEHQTEQQ